MNVFAVYYWLVDVKGWQTWARPLAIYGMNAITVFVLAGLLGRLTLEIKVENLPLKSWLYQNTFAALADPKGINIPVAGPGFDALGFAGLLSWTLPRLLRDVPPQMVCSILI